MTYPAPDQHSSLLSEAITALFVPGDRLDRIRKALASTAQMVIVDLEDAVSTGHKDQARSLAAETLSHYLDQDEHVKQSALALRINGTESRWIEPDLAMFSDLVSEQAHPSVGLMLPKTHSREQLNTVVEKSSETVEIIGLIETARGLAELTEIASHPRIRRLAIGAIDLSVELGCQVGSTTIEYARAQLVVASALAGLPAPLDTPCVDFRNPDVVNSHARRSVEDGYGGTLCIHPAQLEPTRTAFAPDEEKITWANEVLKAAETSDGHGAVSVQGTMIDAPVIAQAHRILTRAGSNMT
ncbi:CoA ester lyase [Auritidibacter sp. NML100628]|uniref:HpcH/HpaI aldolase/citrate lyase family protein n=1 Tax=Auritidibacter sp. NML100628 TaxID=2170742 RepID=UPI000D73695E|nr:CoA ester lyase [Auritidibacter sp. NML100628]PXA76995.1 CoA ester lyase [Auritidibacter sp. NML100628]